MDAIPDSVDIVLSRCPDDLQTENRGDKDPLRERELR